MCAAAVRRQPALRLDVFDSEGRARPPLLTIVHPDRSGLIEQRPQQTRTRRAITAFPVLARILADRGLTRTDLGHAALTCAAINDVMAWALLAAVVGVTRAMPTSGVPGEFVIAFAAGAVIPAGSGLARSAAGRLDTPGSSARPSSR